MNVLVLQLKRIGDLILTTPALSAMHRAGIRIALAVDAPCVSLIPAIPGVTESLIHSRSGSNRDFWRRIRKGGWDACLDYTVNDRSALAAWLTCAPRRITFAYARRRFLRSLAYHEFVDSPVRDFHTCDHALHLLRPLALDNADAMPSLDIPREARERAAALLAEHVTGSFILIHPGTARPEKYWLSERWAAVAQALYERGLACIVTSGPDAAEQAHARAILAAAPSAALLLPQDLLTLAALIEKARLTLSCDTSVVHFAAALRQPQVALFGPTNPYHWRPRHSRAITLSAATKGEPIHDFHPKMRGAPMADLPVDRVIAAADQLLSAPR